MGWDHDFKPVGAVGYPEKQLKHGEEESMLSDKGMLMRGTGSQPLSLCREERMLIYSKQSL